MERKPVYCAKLCTVAEIFEFIFGHKFNDIYFLNRQNFQKILKHLICFARFLLCMVEVGSQKKAKKKQVLTSKEVKFFFPLYMFNSQIWRNKLTDGR